MEFLSKLNYERRCKPLSEEIPEENLQVNQFELQNESSSTANSLETMKSVSLNVSVPEKQNTSISGDCLIKAQQELNSLSGSCSGEVQEVSVIMGNTETLGVNSSVSIMRFINTGVNPDNWRACKMVRENRRRRMAATTSEKTPVAAGAGSEHGAQLQKVRKQMTKHNRREIKREDQPWLLKATYSAETEATQRFKGIKEGGISDHASYFIFSALQKKGQIVYEAFPVQSWYNFKPIPRYNYLTAEEAEEKFKKRNEIHNFFSLMTRKRLGVNYENDEQDCLLQKKKRKLLNAGSDDSSSDDEGENENKESLKRKQRKSAFGRFNNNDDNEGDQEVEYMSSSQTDCSLIDETVTWTDEGHYDSQLNSSESDSDEDKTTTRASSAHVSVQG